jgi:hypothetical protein
VKVYFTVSAQPCSVLSICVSVGKIGSRQLLVTAGGVGRVTSAMHCTLFVSLAGTSNAFGEML